LRCLRLIGCVVDEPSIAKTRVNGLLTCEDGIILRSSLIRFDKYWRVTDGQTEVL